MRSLKDEAARRKLSFSALIAEKAAREPDGADIPGSAQESKPPRQRPDWYGSFSDPDPDLSLKIEEIMGTPEFWGDKFAT